MVLLRIKFLYTRKGGTHKRTWMMVRIDMKKCHLSEDLAPDRMEWRSRIHVVDPNIIGTRL